MSVLIDVELLFLNYIRRFLYNALSQMASMSSMDRILCEICNPRMRPLKDPAPAAATATFGGVWPKDAWAPAACAYQALTCFLLLVPLSLFFLLHPLLKSCRHLLLPELEQNLFLSSTDCKTSLRPLDKTPPSLTFRKYASWVARVVERVVC